MLYKLHDVGAFVANSVECEEITRNDKHFQREPFNKGQAFTKTDVQMWKEEDNKLKATFKFNDFTQAFSFMTEVAFHAEKQQHHPDWHNVYNTVNFALSTHDAGDKVTDKDRKLAKAIDAVFARFR